MIAELYFMVWWMLVALSIIGIVALIVEACGHKK